MTEAFVLDLGLHERWARRRFDGDRTVGLRRPDTLHRLLAWAGRYDRRCSMRTAELLAGGDVPGTVWVGTTHHHLTYGRVAGLPEDVGYLHIDNHTDDFLRPAEEPGETVRTSRFTDQIRSSGRDVGYLGAYGPEAPSLDRRQTHDWEEGVWKGFMEQLPERLYVSVDMDVFDRSVYSATHSQGYLTMETFDEVCGWLDEHREVVAADIIHLDHSPPERNLEPYGRVIDRLLDICSV